MKKRAIMRRRPDATQDDYTASHQGRGPDYSENFESLKMRAILTELEIVAIRSLLKGLEPRRTIDLACGTGRITAILTGALPRSEICGVDVAASMLDVARKSAPEAAFLELDLRQLGQAKDEASVDLITAFRFFPNADPALRIEAFDTIQRLVSVGGYVLVNNHRNFWSLSYLLRRLFSTAAPGALNSEIVGPLVKRGFKVVSSRSLGVLPHSDERAYGLGNSLAARLERFNYQWFSGRHRIGSNTLWLLRKEL